MADTHSSRDDYESQEPPATWLTLPRKGQLLLLFLGRLSDFYQIASLQTYIFYQLSGLSPTLSPAVISFQTGIVNGSFTAAQSVTAVIWGRIADSHHVGRKPVLVVGLLATAASCVGVAFAGSFMQAVSWKIFGGAMNGTVGITRTMLSEIIVEKRYQSRAFLLLPLSFNIAAFFGPILGGLLAPRLTATISQATEASSVGTPPSRWPASSSWMTENFPYAVPSLLSAFFLILVAMGVFLGVEETLFSRKGRYDPGVILAAYLRKWLFRVTGYKFHKYSPIDSIDDGGNDGDDQEELADLCTENHFENNSQNGSNSGDELIDREDLKRHQPQQKPTSKNPVKSSDKNSIRSGFRAAFTTKVSILLLVQGLYDFHLGAFTSILLLYFSTPTDGRGLFKGGLALPPTVVGMSLSTLGLFGTILQLALYPLVHQRLGTLRCYQIFSILFPIAYALTPLLSVFVTSSHAANSPSPSPSPTSASCSNCFSAPMIFSLLLVSLILTAARVFTLPSTIILLNNSASHPSVLGTVHGIGQAVSAGMRTAGAVVGGWVWGVGLHSLSKEGHSGEGGLRWVWAGIVGCATLTWGASLAVKER